MIAGMGQMSVHVTSAYMGSGAKVGMGGVCMDVTTARSGSGTEAGVGRVCMDVTKASRRSVTIAGARRSCMGATSSRKGPGTKAGMGRVYMEVANVRNRKPGRVGHVTEALRSTGVDLPLIGGVDFPYLGSGLLWARSTGCTLWPGAEALSRIMLDANKMSEIAGYVSNSGPRGEPSDGWKWEECITVELGCGLGLVSTTSSVLGARAIATDGDADIVRIAKKNINHNTKAYQQKFPESALHPSQTFVLPWGDDASLKKVAAAVDSLSKAAQRPPVIVLMSDVRYGSNPGIWENLSDTIQGLLHVGGSGSFALQSETYRKELVLYEEYFTILQGSGLSCKELAVPKTIIDSLAPSIEALQEQDEAVQVGVLSTTSTVGQARAPPPKVAIQLWCITLCQ